MTAAEKTKKEKEGLLRDLGLDPDLIKAAWEGQGEKGRKGVVKVMKLWVLVDMIVCLEPFLLTLFWRFFDEKDKLRGDS